VVSRNGNFRSVIWGSRIEWTRDWEVVSRKPLKQGGVAGLEVPRRGQYPDGTIIYDQSALCDIICAR